MTNIAIVGPGAIGGTIAAWLSQNPAHDVTIAARTAFAALAVETQQGTIHATPKVVVRSEDAHVARWVLVATKAYDSAAAAKWFGSLCDDSTNIAILQNGVEHIERFEPFFPRERILPVMIDCPAERIAPGHIRQRGPISMVVPESKAGSAFVDLFANLPLGVSQSPDFRTAVWRKLCLNSAGAVSAVTLHPAGIVQHEGVAELMRGIVLECIAVARAEGALLDDAVADTIIDNMRRSPADSVNSLHADRLAVRPMEIDARNGAIVRIGSKHGIPTPLNAMMVSLLEAVQTTGESC